MSYSRRGFLAAATFGLGAAAVAAVRGPMATADPFSSGSLAQAVQGSLGSTPTGSGLIRPAGTLGYVGVTFPGRDEVAGRIRFGYPDGSLGDWGDLKSLDAGTDEGGTEGSELVAAPTGATSYEVDAPEGARATSFDDGRDGRRENYRSDSRLLGLGIISRAQWGAGEVPETQRDPVFHPAQAITIHHSAVEPGEDRAAAVKSIHDYHTKSLGWADIGYHLLIDPEGNTYQGRAGDGTPVFESSPADGDAPGVITGAHVAGFNAGNIGISLLGDFTRTPPTENAINTTIDVVRALSEAISLDPTQGVRYQHPSSGRTLETTAISGHRDWGGTSCPGDAFFPQLRLIRDAASGGSTPVTQRPNAQQGGRVLGSLTF